MLHYQMLNQKWDKKKKTCTKLKCSNQYKSTYIYKQINATETLHLEEWDGQFSQKKKTEEKTNFNKRYEKREVTV